MRWDRSDALAEAPPDVKATGTAARDGFRIAVKPLAGAPNATLGGIIDLVVCDMRHARRVRPGASQGRHRVRRRQKRRRRDDGHRRPPASESALAASGSFERVSPQNGWLKLT